MNEQEKIEPGKIEQETIEPEYNEMKEEFEIKMDDSKIKIEMNDDTIIFTLIKDISYYKYIKENKYNEIIEELGIDECKDIKDVFNYLRNSEYKILRENNKISINNKEVTLYQKTLTNEELIKLY